MSGAIQRQLRRFAPLALWMIAGLAAAASIFAWLVYLTSFAHPGEFGTMDFRGVGTDWMVYHAVAQNYLSGHMAIIYHGQLLTAYVNHHYAPWLHGMLSYRAWIYPPTYLLVIVPFGYLGFPLSYALFQITTAACLIAAIATVERGRAARLVPLATLLSPGAAMNVLCGQNAFLIAALLVAGISLEKKRPILAGAILGLASMKPQLALLVPVALAATGRWRVLAAMIASALLLAAVSAAIFGVDAWIVWLHGIYGGLVSDDTKWIEAGRLWGISVWTCAILLGASRQAASLVQYAAMAFAAFAVFLSFQRNQSLNTRLAVLLAATILAAPYTTLYDAVLLSLAASFWLAERARYREAAAALMGLVVWIVPDISPPMAVAAGRLAPLLILSFIVFALARAGREQQAPTH